MRGPIRALGWALVLTAVSILSGCASGQFTSDQEAAILCRSYAATLSILAPYRPRMSDDMVATVEQARAVLTPACGGAQLSGLGFADADLVKLRDHLRRMLIIEQQARGRNA